jgi:hypothetical protein
MGALLYLVVVKVSTDWLLVKNTVPADAKSYSASFVVGQFVFVFARPLVDNKCLFFSYGFRFLVIAYVWFFPSKEHGANLENKDERQGNC